MVLGFRVIDVKFRSLQMDTHVCMHQILQRRHAPKTQKNKQVHITIAGGVWWRAPRDVKPLPMLAKVLEEFRFQSQFKDGSYHGGCFRVSV